MIRFFLSFLIVKTPLYHNNTFQLSTVRGAGRAGLASSQRSGGTVLPALPPAQAQTSGGQHPPPHCFLTAIPALPACVLLGSVPCETLLLQPLHMQLLSCFLCVCLYAVQLPASWLWRRAATSSAVWYYRRPFVVPNCPNLLTSA